MRRVRRSNPGAMLAAAVLYAKKHAANPAFGDAKKLALALQLGDLMAAAAEADTAENKQEYEWEIHFWLDTFRLLEPQLGAERRARWQREIEKITRWFAGQVAYRIDFPRLSGTVYPHFHQSPGAVCVGGLFGGQSC